MSGARKPKADHRVPDREAMAVSLRASGQPVRAIAEQLGCSHASIIRWVNKPEAQAAIEAHRIQVLADLTTKMRALATDALDVLAEKLADEEAPDRLKAVELVLSRVMPTTQKVDLTAHAEKMSNEELEASLRQLGWRKGGTDG